jgi:ADP-ribose pyrophosphatase YjhB (NUDIX family)
MSPPIDHFRYCPACGQALPPPTRPNAAHCSICGFQYFISLTVAAGAVVARPDGAVLFIRRGKEPEKGKLALPGGFIEMGETAEVSLRRELIEEVGLNVGPLEYLCSEINAYDYRSITYPVLDLFFTAQVGQTADPKALDDVAEVCWLDPARVDPADIAFPSVRAAVRLYSARITALEDREAIQIASEAPPVRSGQPPDSHTGR